MILGVGIDLTEIGRVAQMIDRWGERFISKVFTEGERAYAVERARPAMHLAARFAAKEAALKALGVPSRLSWHEIEVANERGRPVLRLSGRALEAANALGVVRMHLTITHAADMACAAVIAEGHKES